MGVLNKIPVKSQMVKIIGKPVELDTVVSSISLQ